MKQVETESGEVIWIGNGVLDQCEQTYEYPNRIMVTNGYNERFHGRVVEVANNIANRICGLYNTFTDDYHTSYIIQ